MGKIDERVVVLELGATALLALDELAAARHMSAGEYVSELVDREVAGFAA